MSGAKEPLWDRVKEAASILRSALPVAAKPRYARGGFVPGVGVAPRQPPARIIPLRSALNDRAILEDLADVLYDLPTQDQAESYNSYAQRLVSRMSQHGLMVIRK